MSHTDLAIGYPSPRSALPGIAPLFSCLFSIVLQPAIAAQSPADVDATRIEEADKEPGNWLSYGRTYSEQRFSPLTGVTAENVKQLGLAWYADLDSNRGQEATPLMIDGVLYVSTAWSLVRAFDAQTGKLLWTYDPAVPRALGVRACCDVVNRGVAAWRGKIFVATLDGRLIALDARSGTPVWSVMTVDPDKPYTITMAPRVIKGRVVIGNSGNEYGVRGYVSAYDVETGKLAWRFYTVPGDPSKSFENDAMAMAAKTWSGEWWKLGGGGAAWESISYDPNLNLIYIGTGNGTEWNQKFRSASHGDNLFLSSVIAINADTGGYVWHYQVTPGDEWDFDAVQQLILADLSIDGMQRKVLMQANKNGFFYVIDRKSGQLISARNFTPVTWTSGIDVKTGRPIENPGIRYDKTGKRVELLPGALGAHSWQSMAFNPKTGLVYIPAQEIPMSYASVTGYKPGPIGWNVGTETSNLPKVKGYLVAWDPVHQKEVWRANYLGPWNGGILTSAGNLVIQGNAAGDISAYRADSGEKLWSMFAQSPVMAAPISYEVKNEQYIAVLSGWGGAYPLLQGQTSDKSGNQRVISRLLVFKLGAKTQLPALPPEPKLVIDPPADTASPGTIAAGKGLYDQFCTVCHGEAAVAGGVTPDLRGSPFIAVDAWYSVVLEGALKEGGMASFGQVLDRDKATAIRTYILHRANESIGPGSATSRRQADPNHGAMIATKGTASGAPACVACHAANSATESGAFPRIAGQSAFYLSRQLSDFASGVRSNPVMAPIARALSSDDVADVAAFYASTETRIPPLVKGDAQLIERGKQLAEAGDSTRGVSGCRVCHGASGAGESPTVPYLAAQFASYTASQLKMWQQGFRRNSPTTMELFAKKLDDQAVAAVAAYYQQLSPSGPPMVQPAK